MMLRAFATAAAVLVLMPLTSAEAGEPEAVGRGRILAERWCSDCHAVHAGDLASRNRAAPRFADVAASEAGSEVVLRAFFKNEHEKMPAIRLDAQQIEDVVSYILSLRRQN
jgi:mono/diheme cytochrome c family protein